eukprot:CCRYP_015599-RA/>CCRYP_015599-RA protein AED:0.06 eAED:0.06 QI:77/1/1/1/0.6/0.16/6/2714/358
MRFSFASILSCYALLLNNAASLSVGPSSFIRTHRGTSSGPFASSIKLHSAATSADGSFGSGATADIPSLNVRYGPAIKIGKLRINLFGAIFGLWEVFWGVFFWYPAMTLYGLLRRMPGDLLGKLDPFRRIPICIGYTWGLIVMTLFGMWAKVEGRENLEVLREVDKNGKKGKLKPAMYVANHCSWMDIPFVCQIFGFLNYKIIAKAELLKVPILGKAIQVGGHIFLDRTNRKSQMAAFKSGVQCLKDGINLVTFPEGTRSKTSRMGSFKMGAFKMAQSVGASIVPVSISYADKVQPLDFAFPTKPSMLCPRAVVKVGKPIPTEGETDSDLLEKVWNAIADGLPESQKPSPGTPVGVQN